MRLVGIAHMHACPVTQLTPTCRLVICPTHTHELVANMHKINGSKTAPTQEY